MPKIVDREARRTEIAEAYLRLVARDGSEGATSRALAGELGVATGALWHYFRGFDELLSRAFELIFEQTTARIHAGAAGSRGVTALRAAIDEIMPARQLTQSEAFVAVAFWGRVPARPVLGGIQARVEDEWRGIILGFLREATDDAEVIETAPLATIADLLLVVASGLQVEYVLRSDTSQPDRQLAIVDSVLAPWLTPSAPPRS